MAIKFLDKLAKDFALLRGGRYGNRAEDRQREQQHALENSSRSRRSGLALYSGLVFWVLLAAWVLLNLLASQFPARLNIDASDDKLYSLSPTSMEILQGLQQEIRIYALFSEGRRPTKPLDIYRYLELYQSSSRHIAVEEVDPELEPERIRPFITGIKGQGRGNNKAPKRNSLIVFRPGGRFRVLHYSELYYVMQRFGPKNPTIRAEQQISSAIAYIDGANVAQLGLLTGHNEQSLELMKPNFEQFNIAAQSVELLQGPAALQGMDVLLIYKPQLDLSSQEYQYLRSYLGGVEGSAKVARRKSVWLILDFQAQYLPNFYQLSRDYGLEILEGLVLERDPLRTRAASGYTTFVTPIDSLPKPNENVARHAIIRPLEDNVISDLLWVETMAVRESQPRPYRLRFYSLVESSKASLLRSSRDPSSLAQLPNDLNGPLTLMGMTVWQDEQGSRSGPAFVVSFDVPGNKTVFSTPSNRQLFYSALSWLGNSTGDAQSNSMVFPSKSLLMLPMRLSQAQAVWWAIAFVVLLPLTVLLAGSLFLWHRKRL